MRRNSVRIVLVLALAAPLLGGCASGATFAGMTVPAPAAASANPKLEAAIAVGAVSGGQETNPLWESKVDNANFKAALQASLANAGYLAPSPQAATYTLDAALQPLDQPWIGLDLDVTSTAIYRLVGPAGTRTYPVAATGTGTFADSPLAAIRLRIANERSMQKNIAQFLAELRDF